MDLNLFRAFDSIYRSGSLTEAAKELHITQPAVSNSLARLREHFHDPLFERHGRGIQPTSLAHEIANDIAGALLTLQSTAKRGQTFDKETSHRKFVLSLLEPLELPLLPELVRQLRSEAPNVRLQSLRIGRDDLVRHLSSGDVDIVVDVPQRVAAGIANEPILTDEMCVVMRKGHAASKTTWGIEAYLQAMHIAVSRRNHGSVYEDFELERLGHYRDVVLRGNSYHSACHIAARTDLILTLPRFLARHYQALMPLHCRRVPFRLPPVSVMMYWHRSQERDTAHNWLRQQLRRQADKVAQSWPQD
nr:LysR family transcriptional regulator [Oceanococcus sp. HetDA_MAG_MS8]